MLFGHIAFKSCGNFSKAALRAAAGVVLRGEQGFLEGGRGGPARREGAGLGGAAAGAGRPRGREAGGGEGRGRGEAGGEDGIGGAEDGLHCPLTVGWSSGRTSGRWLYSGPGPCSAQTRRAVRPGAECRDALLAGPGRGQRRVYTSSRSAPTRGGGYATLLPPGTCRARCLLGAPRPSREGTPIPPLQGPANSPTGRCRDPARGGPRSSLALGLQGRPGPAPTARCRDRSAPGRLAGPARGDRWLRGEGDVRSRTPGDWGGGSAC